MRKYSKANGYPTALCEKMVDPDMEVYQCKFSNGDGPLPLRPGTGRTEGRREAGDGDEADRRQGQAADHGSTRRRTPTASRAPASPASTTPIALVAAPGAQRIVSEVDWSEEMVRFLNSAAVSSLLMIIGTIAVYICFKTPGFGAPETRRDRLLRHPVPEQVHGRPRDRGGHPAVRRGARPDRRRDLRLAGTRRPGASRGHLHHRVARAGVPELLHPEAANTTGSSASSSTT